MSDEIYTTGDGVSHPLASIYTCGNCGIEAGCLDCDVEWHDVAQCFSKDSIDDVID